MDFSNLGETAKKTPIYYQFQKTGETPGLVKKEGTAITVIETLNFIPLEIIAKEYKSKKNAEGLRIVCKIFIGEEKTAELTIGFFEENEIFPNKPNTEISLLELLRQAIDNNFAFCLKAWTKHNATGSEKLKKDCYLVNTRCSFLSETGEEEASATCYKEIGRTPEDKPIYQMKYDFQKKSYKAAATGTYKASQLEEFWAEFKDWTKPLIK